jgi:opacity protein-like surface antigen
MKKVFIIAFCTLAIFSKTNAQTKFSVQGGLNLMQMKASASGLSIEFDADAALNLGVIADFKGTDKFNLRSGLVYNGNSSSLTFDGEKQKTTVNYLSVPLLGRFRISEGLYAIAGPQISFLLSAKERYDGSTSEDVKDALKSSNFSGLLGAEYQFSDKFRLGVNYTTGISNIAKERLFDTEDVGKLKFNGFNLNIGVSF